jgi:CRP-like cAMP-binding protein
MAEKKNGEGFKKIIVADISHTVRLLTKKYLEGKYDVLEAKSGQDIFSLLSKNHACDSHCLVGRGPEKEIQALPERNSSCRQKNVEMIILCMEFPDATSFEIAEKIRKKFHSKCLPILLSTSSNKREIINSALECGINDFIVKPFPKELLLSKINKLERDIPLQDLEMSEMIAKIPTFRGVPPSQVAFALSTCGKTLMKKKGESICEEGEENFDLYILLEGKCSVLFQGKKVADINPIDTIGEMGFFGEQKRSATVVASEPSKVIVLNKELFDEYLNEERAVSETMCKNIILSLNDRIKKSNEMVKKLKIMAEEYLSY